MVELVRFAHYIVDPSDLEDALEHGTPVTALCGKRWVPSRAPELHQLCPTCSERLLRGRWGA